MRSERLRAPAATRVSGRSGGTAPGRSRACCGRRPERSACWPGRRRSSRLRRSPADPAGTRAAPVDSNAMRTGLRRRAGAAVSTALVCLVVAGVVLGAGYGLQRVALRAPTRGELLTARAVGVLLRYRYIESDIRVAGQPTLHARCMQGWLPGRDGRPAGRGARLILSDGERLLAGDRRVVRLARGSTRTPIRPIAEVELAGCPRPLTDHLASRL